jgi:hypothetical protein
MVVGAGEALRQMANRSVIRSSWNDELLAPELQELRDVEFDLSLTEFDPVRLTPCWSICQSEKNEKANAEPPETPVPAWLALAVRGHTVFCAAMP